MTEDENALFQTTIQLFNAERYRPENAEKTSEQLLEEVKALVNNLVAFAKSTASNS